MAREYYIALEGIDGSGKSTLAKLLAARLKAEYPHREIIAVREPGNSSMGTQLRSLAIGNSSYSASTRALAIALDRALHIEENIIPALHREAIIVSDRCFLSSLVYQSYAEGLTMLAVSQTCDLAIGGVTPDLVLWIDTPVEVAISRLTASQARGRDYFERQGAPFLSKLRQGYTAIASDLGIDPIDDVGTPEEMASSLFEIVKPHIEAFSSILETV